jgi:hypothetical protein
VVGELLVLAARAAADLAEGSAGHASGPDLRTELAAFREQAPTDPLGTEQTHPERAALAATWSAETARLDGVDSVEAWVGAATQCQKARRPHDAGYCRWRAAQAASRTGDLGVASRLLRAASRDASQHVPLLDAIRASAVQPT